MKSKYTRGLFIFHRDLRLEDNTGLLRALKECEEVVCCFLFDIKQVGEKNEYRAANGIRFMLNSLEELSEELEAKGGKLLIAYGESESCLKAMIHKLGITACYSNYDYTPFAQKRDNELRLCCEKENIDWYQEHDYMLTIPGSVLSGSKTPYTVFTPFYRKAMTYEVALPEHNKYTHYAAIEGNSTLDQVRKKIDTSTIELRTRGGRKEGLKLLEDVEKLVAYEQDRNYPAVKGTSLLSAHNKFGTLSIREVYYSIAHSLGEEHGIIQELYWRDFFTQIAYNFPHVFSGAFRKMYDALPWENNEEFIQAWQEGKTGFPIVDAGMRELVQTGYMHNRVRMIVASFLVKDLLVDWHIGERFFALHLTDYDPAVNNGNWQWAASTGCDAQPYFRIFNPWSQQQKFDKEAVYIKHWVPELRQYSAKEIHDEQFSGYIPQIVSHAEQRIKALELFKSVRD